MSLLLTFCPGGRGWLERESVFFSIPSFWKSEITMRNTLFLSSYCQGLDGRLSPPGHLLLGADGGPEIAVGY